MTTPRSSLLRAHARGTHCLRCIRAVAIVAAATLAPASAVAQPSAPATKRAPASTVVVSTADYRESRIDGDQVVEFPGDPLGTDGPSIYGDVVRRPPGVIRMGLVRLRLNFVSELVKSVENL